MKIWFTLTGTNHYYGHDFLEKGMKIRLEKEPDNRHDHEAMTSLSSSNFFQISWWEGREWIG